MRFFLREFYSVLLILILSSIILIFFFQNCQKNPLFLNNLNSIHDNLKNPPPSLIDPPQTQVNCDFYVSPKGNDIWSGKFPAANQTQSDGPLKSLERVRTLVREKIRLGMNASITICLRGGDYYLERTIEFGPQDSGRNGFQVIYRAFPNEEPIIHGAASLPKEWIKTIRPGMPSDVYQISIGTDLNIHSLYVEHRRVIKARLPNIGYHLASLPTSTPYLSFTYREGELPELANLTGLQTVIWPNGDNSQINWYERVRNVRSIDKIHQTIELQSPVQDVLSIGDGARYYLQGRPEFLDSPGEFYYDRNQGVLYYFPFDGKSPNESDVYAPSIVTMISFRGTSSARVENITFQGLTFYHGGASGEEDEVGAINLSHGTQNIRFESCRMELVGSCGISISNESRSIVIQNSLFQDIGYYGVYIQGNSFEDISHEHQVHNNLITNTGVLVGHGDAIYLESASRSRISHNLIYNTRRHSIEIAASWNGDLATNHTRENIVEFNDVSMANTDSQDTGLLYMWGYTWKNIIRNNRVHDSSLFLEDNYGIYLDGWTDSTTVENNIICNLGGANSDLRGALVAHGTNHRFINNIIKNNIIHTQASWGAPTFGATQLSYNRGPHGGHIFERNIFFQTGDIQYSAMNYDNTLLISVNNNLYWGHQTNLFARMKTPTDAIARSLNFQQWQNEFRFDLQSRVENPKFINEQGCDVTLANDSPAFALGFNKIETQSIGLDPQFPFVCYTKTHCVRSHLR